MPEIFATGPRWLTGSATSFSINDPFSLEGTKNASGVAATKEIFLSCVFSFKAGENLANKGGCNETALISGLRSGHVFHLAFVLHKLGNCRRKQWLFGL